MRYKGVVAYDGTNYSGFQRQRSRPTIQEALEQSIEAVSGHPATVLAAGRTDAGVHALGQVIALDLRWKGNKHSLLRALNANLPSDIAFLAIDSTRDDFHPRFDARRRKYNYRIYESPVRSPCHRLYSWHVRSKLEINAMNEAAQSLLGTKDFGTFGQPPQGDNTIREVFRAYWDRKDEILIFEIEANAFLTRMVRSLVGTMKLIGEGRLTVKDFKEALDTRTRSNAGQTAPSHGLFLVSVTY